jgi:hypothetical protein
MFHVFYFVLGREMIVLGKQYHSGFTGEMGYFLTGESQQLLYNYHSRESLTKIFPYSYPFYHIYHCPTLAVPRLGSSLCGELLGLGFVTDKETEDFHSELPKSIAVLLAVRDYPHSLVVTAAGKRNYSVVSSAWRIGCTSFRLPSWNLLQVLLQWGGGGTYWVFLNFTLFTVLPLLASLKGVLIPTSRRMLAAKHCHQSID